MESYDLSCRRAGAHYMYWQTDWCSQCGVFKDKFLAQTEADARQRGGDAAVGLGFLYSAQCVLTLNPPLPSGLIQKPPRHKHCASHLLCNRAEKGQLCQPSPSLKSHTNADFNFNSCTITSFFDLAGNGKYDCFLCHSSPYDWLAQLIFLHKEPA